MKCDFKLRCCFEPQVLFGTADGQVIVMDCHGRMLAHILLHEAEGITSMAWNYPSFLVEDSSESDTDSDDYTPLHGNTRLPSYSLVTKKSMFTAHFRMHIDFGFMLGLLKCSQGKRFIIIQPLLMTCFYYKHTKQTINAIMF